jgi:hypothetical protein
MSDPDDPGEEFDPRLNEEDRRSLARVRRRVAEAKAAGRWETKPPFEDTDKFDGPFGVDAEGNVLIYHTVEEARAAAAERDRRRRAEVEAELERRRAAADEPTVAGSRPEDGPGNGAADAPGERREPEQPT